MDDHWADECELENEGMCICCGAEGHRECNKPPTCFWDDCLSANKNHSSFHCKYFMDKRIPINFRPKVIESPQALRDPDDQSAGKKQQKQQETRQQAQLRPNESKKKPQRELVDNPTKVRGDWVKPFRSSSSSAQLNRDNDETTSELKTEVKFLRAMMHRLVSLITDRISADKGSELKAEMSQFYKEGIKSPAVVDPKEDKDTELSVVKRARHKPTLALNLSQAPIANQDEDGDEKIPATDEPKSPVLVADSQPDPNIVNTKEKKRKEDKSPVKTSHRRRNELDVLQNPYKRGKASNKPKVNKKPKANNSMDVEQEEADSDHEETIVNTQEHDKAKANLVSKYNSALTKIYTTNAKKQLPLFVKQQLQATARTFVELYYKPEGFEQKDLNIHCHLLHETLKNSAGTSSRAVMKISERSLFESKGIRSALNLNE